VENIPLSPDFGELNSVEMVNGSRARLMVVCGVVIGYGKVSWLVRVYDLSVWQKGVRFGIASEKYLM
jgi:hypothetical protein